MRAVIFDLDGVLVPTGLIHRASLIKAIWQLTGIDSSGHPAVSETSMLSSAAKIEKIQHLLNFDTRHCADILTLKDKIFSDEVQNLILSDNVAECISYIRSINIKTAIASNSRKINIDRILDVLMIRDCFDTVVSSDDVTNRKPAPDMLFEVYKRLDVDGRNTLFIDDTDEGAAAGYSSLSTVIKINSPEDLIIPLIKPWIEEWTPKK